MEHPTQEEELLLLELKSIDEEFSGPVPPSLYSLISKGDWLAKKRARHLITEFKKLQGAINGKIIPFPRNIDHDYQRKRLPGQAGRQSDDC